MIPENPRLWDISPEVSESLAVFPGDAPFKRDVVLSFAKGAHLNLSGGGGTFHLGAHADAPSHYSPTGQSIESRSLLPYLGKCQVISMRPSRGVRISVHDWNRAGATVSSPRILFKTLSFEDPTKWKSDFTALSPELVDHLATLGVRLLGIDTPSVDAEDSKLLETHARVLAHDVSLLEGLRLNDVPDGIYDLVALPIKIKGAEAAWVRAVLMARKESA